MKNRKKILFYLYFIEVFILIFISILIMCNAPAPQTFRELKQRLINPLKLTIKVNQTKTSIKSTIFKITNETVSKYLDTCPHSDYFNPISNTCMNTSFLKLTLISSLDTVYLMGNKQLYKRMRNEVEKGFTCNVNHIISTRDLVTHVIGGLISIYSLTEDELYLTKLEECSEIALQSFQSSIYNYKVPAPYFNPITRQTKYIEFLNGNTLAESSSFLLEFNIIAKLLNNRRYSQAIDNYFNNLNKLKTNEGYPYFLPITHSSGIDMKYHINGYSAPFYANAIRLYLARKKENEKNVVDTFLDIFVNTKISKVFGYGDSKSTIFESSICQLYPLLRQINQTKTRAFRRIRTKCIEMSTDVLPLSETGVETLFENSDRSSPFSFDASVVEDTLYRNTNFDEVDFLSYIEESTYRGVFCSLIEQNPSEFEDELPIEAISKWAKFIYLLGTDLPYHTFVFNEVGHFIPK